MTRSAASSNRIALRTLQRVADLPADAWDRCAGQDNPFVAHAFLNALEQSGCVTPRTGWQPVHLVAEIDGAIAGILPLYVKGHSQGEYIFDHGWAEAYARAGGQYYPKLLSAVPFTPVTGPRFLVAPGQDFDGIASALVQGAQNIARQHGLSSLHVNFLPEEQADWAREKPDLLLRLGEQFHWRNEGYGDFEAFLAQLNSRKRKAIRKERREAVAAGIEIVVLQGDALRPEHWDAFFEFYMDTGSRKWGRPYLNRDFFARLHETMANRIVLVMARREGRWIAGAWNMLGSDALYGRNWGCSEYHPGLHFECCYYQAIDYAIRHGLARVEAGAQGEHKLARGYLPVPIHSAHWMADPGFQQAVARYLDEERAYMAGMIEALDQQSPFRQAQAEPETE
ncbi:GNAT family N-acetyltransferase [Ferrovibrio sp.]|uniref:GNAT family N-acetyltransferase n=1 Tax=Ferrovibrio sp. TaxID=1917215 RepID=UPI0026081DC2|nr:GNAT family N-acetyltransferase [Ferrovibrio sp.]